MNKAFLLTFCLVLCMVASYAQDPVPDPPAAADTIRPMQPKPIVRPLGTDSVVMARAAFMKYDLARQTLLQLSFDDIDALISVQRQQLQTCEQAKDRIYAQAQLALHLARDSLRAARRLLPEIKQGTENAVDYIRKAQQQIVVSMKDIRRARWATWKERIRAGLAGAGLALLIQQSIRVIR